MASPPKKKIKSGQQLTLFGGVATGSSVHGSPRTLYEKFVDAFVVRFSDGGTKKADLVTKAQAKWRGEREKRGS